MAKVAERFGFDRRTTSWEEIVEDEEVDIFANLGPDHVHADPSIRTLEEGKHVFCEKSLTDNLEDAEKMVKPPEKRGKGLPTGSIADMSCP